MAKSPFDLHMHEGMTIGDVSESCYRVPGGWIYTLMIRETEHGGPLYQAIFVPWSESVEVEFTHRKQLIARGVTPTVI